MNLTFVKVEDDPRAVWPVDADLLNTGLFITGEPRTGVDILRPVFILSCPDSAQMTAIMQYNYVWCLELGRFYAITNFVLNGKELLCECRIDVLKTYANSILNSQNYILRTGNPDPVGSGILVDMQTVFTSAKQTRVDNVQNNYANNESGGAYTIGLVGKGGYAEYFVLTPQQLRQLFSLLYGTNWYGDVGEDITDDLTRILFNPAQYIASLVWFPIMPPTKPGNGSMNFGWWTLQSNAPMLADDHTEEFQLTFPLYNHPQLSVPGLYPDNLNQIARKVSVYIPPFGSIPVDMTTYGTGNVLIAHVTVDYRSGAATLRFEGRPEVYSASMGIQGGVGTAGGNIQAGLTVAGLSLVGGAVDTVSDFFSNIFGGDKTGTFTHAPAQVYSIPGGSLANAPGGSSHGSWSGGSGVNYGSMFSPVADKKNP